MALNSPALPVSSFFLSETGYRVPQAELPERRSGMMTKPFAGKTGVFHYSRLLWCWGPKPGFMHARRALYQLTFLLSPSKYPSRSNQFSSGLRQTRMGNWAPPSERTHASLVATDHVPNRLAPRLRARQLSIKSSAPPPARGPVCLYKRPGGR